MMGQVGLFKTTAANISELERSRALRTYADQIPETIRDAMEFVFKMGDRYWWVDALCIIQDDNIEKHDRILPMHQIYSTAYATVVQHAGNDAKAGLPGLRPYTRSVLATEAFPLIIAIIAIGNSASRESCANQCIHSTRGWTL